ncbi:methyltransferase [Apiospora arundinis]
MASGSNPPPEDAGEGPGDSAPKFGKQILSPRARDVDWESVTSSITNYRVENGRTYHAYKDGSYLYPNDTDEQDRQQFEHVILQHLMGGRLYFAPWSQEHPPRRVLDIGTGTGIWAVEVGFEYPTAKVLGTDLSAIQPTDVPPNVEFYVEDTRDPWHWYRQEDRFDYIHTRMTLGCWEDLKVDVVQKSFDQLEPGGWFESQDLLSSILCDDGTMTDDNPLKLHFEDIEDATASEGRPLRSGDRWRKACEEVGFVDITEYVFKVPINGWPRELRWKELGKMWEANFLHGIQAVTYGPLGRIRKLTRNQMEMLLLDVRKAISDTSVHAYQKFFIVLARKPYPDEVRQPAAASSTTEDISMADC